MLLTHLSTQLFRSEHAFFARPSHRGTHAALASKTDFVDVASDTNGARFISHLAQREMACSARRSGAGMDIGLEVVRSTKT